MRTPRGRRLWSPPTSHIRAIGSAARLRLYCRPLLPRLFGLRCVRVGPRRLLAPPSTSTSPPDSLLRAERTDGLKPRGRKPVLYAHEVILNELAQGLRPTAEGVEWFEGLSEDDRRKVLHALVLFCG
ncbi:DUF5958 family protein [Streptomyces sp. NPDC005141]